MVRLECRATATTILQFLPGEEGYKGSAFHSRFEYALSRIDPEAHRVLCSRDHTLNPYVLDPPVDFNPATGWPRNAQPFFDATYPEGRQFRLGLTLIGPAIKHARACKEALTAARRGNTKALKGEFALTSVEVVDFQLPELDLASHEARMTIVFDTMLRLHCGERRVPEFKSLVDSLLKKAERLPLTDIDGRPVGLLGTPALRQAAMGISLQEHRLKWYDWPRYSLEQESIRGDPWDRYGGWLGTVTYAGTIAPFMPLLLTGEWFHAGAKSAFGLGRYRVENYEEEETK